VPLLLKPLVRAGVGIVSGLAYGIDIAAHQVAIQYTGWGIAVLGSGFDAIYPSTHRRYAEALIANGGCVISEYSPATGARPYFFPARNRIIAALSPLTLVVEARHASGTMHTVRSALALQRQVAAVPGPIDTSSSTGTNQLIKDGAQVITSADDLAQLLAVSLHEMVVVLPDHPDVKALYEVVPLQGISTDSLAEKLQWPVGRILQGITVLELHGTLINRHGLWHRN
jgi:DNA processing protein